MKRFIEGVDRNQSTLFPERLEDWISEDNPVRVIDVFVDGLDLGGLGFERVAPRDGTERDSMETASACKPNLGTRATSIICTARRADTSPNSNSSPAKPSIARQVRG